MPRLNDTNALRSAPMADVDKTTSTRKIDNGYITSHSTYNKKTGSFVSSEEYSEKMPSSESHCCVGNESLSDTKKYLGNDI